MARFSTKKSYQNRELCAACKGQCCKMAPGIYVPEDFDDDLDPKSIQIGITDLLVMHTGIVATRYCGYDQAEEGYIYIIRPTTVYEVEVPHLWANMNNMGQCSRLKDKGCELVFEDRPFQCRKLVPSQTISGEINCHYVNQHHSIEALAKRWLPYQDVIKSAVAAADIILDTIMEHLPAEKELN